CAPIYLTFDNFLSMNSFEPLFWMSCAAIVLRILNGGDARLWLLFGVIGGIGVLNKHSMLFFGSGLALGLLLTPARKVFRSPWTWCGAGMIFLHGKIYYLAPAYIMLLAGGAVWIEKHALPRTGFWLKPVLIVPLLLGAAIAAPLAMPILPVRQAIRYCVFWDVKAVQVE